MGSGLSLSSNLPALRSLLDLRSQCDLFSGKDSIRRSGTSGEKSTGLGMYIIQKYVKLMGGILDVQSEVGKGTQFNLKIPIKK